MKQLFFYLTFSLIVLSCKNHPNAFDLIIQPDTKDYKAISLPVMTRSGLFYNTQDYIIVMDIYKSQDKGIYIFDRATLDYITSTGTLGKGPNEIARYGGIYSKHPNFYVSDFGKQKIWEFNIDSVIKNENYLPKYIIDFELLPEVDPISFFIKDGTLYFMSIDDSYLIKYLSSNETKSIGNDKFSHQRIPEMKNMGKSGNQELTINSTWTKYSVSFRHDNVIIVVNSDFKLKHKYIEGERPSFKMDVFSDKEFYLGLKSDSNFIYTAYSGGKPSVIKDELGIPKGSWPNKIRVFDWACNPVVEFQIESEFYDYFIDPEYKRVIIYTVDNENPIKYFNYCFNNHLKITNGLLTIK